MTATLRAVMESGAAWDDPSEDLLYELLGDVERGAEQFIIVERLVDQSQQTHAQVIRADDGSWLVERRDGLPEEHYRAIVPDLRTAHRALTAWAFILDGWRDSAAWARVAV